MQAQERIRNANILLVNIKALGNEIAKNLVLAGIGSLTVLDSTLVTEDDLGSQFLISAGDVGNPVGYRMRHTLLLVLTSLLSALTLRQSLFKTSTLVSK